MTNTGDVGGDRQRGEPAAACSWLLYRRHGAGRVVVHQEAPYRGGPTTDLRAAGSGRFARDALTGGSTGEGRFGKVRNRLEWWPTKQLYLDAALIDADSLPYTGAKTKVVISDVRGVE